MIERVHKNMKVIAGVSVLVWLVFQVVAICHYWGSPQYSDAQAYQDLAWQCYGGGTWYPTVEHIATGKYIFNPGYVNWLILHLYVFHSLEMVAVTNLVLNMVLLLALFRIVKKLANLLTGYYFVALFCWMYSNILVTVVTMSDLLFVCLVYSSLALSRNRVGYLLVAGMLMALAGYVRPLTVVFVVPLVVYMLLKRYKLRSFVSYFGAMGVVLLGIACFNSAHNGHFIVSSSTGGVNLLMGANDDMTGTFCGEVFDEGKKGYVNPVDKLDVFEKDKFWKEQAVSWIKEHPWKYLAYVPVKLARLWVGDDYHSLVLAFRDKEKGTVERLSDLFLHSIVYYVACILFVFHVCKYWRRFWGIEGVCLLPLLLVSGMQALLYGGMRYHYPFVPVILLFAAWYLSALNDKTKLK